MNKSMLILGRQPELGLAELESLYGPSLLELVGKEAVIVDVDPCVLDFRRLGGSIKCCSVLTTIDTTRWSDIKSYLVKVSPDHSKDMPEGKMQLGISAYGFNVDAKQVLAAALSIKKTVQTTGRSVRVTPNQAPALNSAQIIHNHLTGSNGWELVLVRSGNQTIIGRTVGEQDITSYTARDRGRPKRDARIGMLPPKLAQVIINLAAGKLDLENQPVVCDPNNGQPAEPKHIEGQLLLDPFCGSGVILQEALLMGYNVYGSDINGQMVSASEQNLEWLFSQQTNSPIFSEVEAIKDLGKYSVEAGDATSHKWADGVSLIASETYLGRPFTERPNPELLNQTASECNLIIKKFLSNIHKQLPAGARLCLAIPAWQIRPGEFKHLPLIDQVEDLGYNRVRFKQASSLGLIYFREDQVVARELLVITRQNVTR